MKVLFSGEIHVDYGQIFVYAEDGELDIDRAFVGQGGVGLCGAGAAGTLILMTGLRYGSVRFTAELYDIRPALDQTWEEIVEVPFRPVSEGTRLRQWNGRASWELGLEVGGYRARYSATGMDAGWGKNVREDDEPVTDDRYLLQFWPATPEPARLLKQTGVQAANWHSFASARG